MSTADTLDDARWAVAKVALPCFEDDPPYPLQHRALSSVTLPVELEFPLPEGRVRLRGVRVTARAMVPVASVHEDRQASAGIGDVWATRSLPPIEPITPEARFAECATQS
jgi:hypothetical protein